MKTVFYKIWQLWSLIAYTVPKTLLFWKLFTKMLSLKLLIKLKALWLIKLKALWLTYLKDKEKFKVQTKPNSWKLWAFQTSRKFCSLASTRIYREKQADLIRLEKWNDSKRLWRGIRDMGICTTSNKAIAEDMSDPSAINDHFIQCV